MSQLAAVLNFIQKIEQENVGKSAYEIANLLRGYTKKQYTTLLWSTATGYKQEYIEGEWAGKLNQEAVILSGQVTDFGHFIAALSDQINQPGVNWSDLTNWTGDDTSWAGDIGSAIILYRSPDRTMQLNNLTDALDKLASDSDYAANIAAYLIGAMINSGTSTTISEAIYKYDSILYSENIKTFINKRFAGVIEERSLINAAEVEAGIRRTVSTFIKFSSVSDVFKSVKDLLKLQRKLDADNTTLPNGADLLQGSLHFLNYLAKVGDLDSLKFKPYQMPEMPWLGKVNYEVKVLN